MRSWLALAGALALPLPWFILRAMGVHPDPVAQSAITGIAILGAAFLLSWAAELFQLDVSQAFALALLALIAILPEYSVDMVFAFKAGRELAEGVAEPVFAQYAIANMTGANRLLIGAGWSLVVFLYWLKFRKREVILDRGQIVELAVLAVATLYSFVVVLKGSLGLVDLIVYVSLFVMYIIATSRLPAEEPHMEGPPAKIAAFGVRTRRVITGGLFAYAGAAIFIAAEPFAEGLIASGKILGVDEFLLVQWLAPLASESPEFIITALFALRGQANVAVRALISSKVNQWTLLVGMLPLVYSIGAGGLNDLRFDARQTEEVLLTAAQSIFAVAIVANLRFSLAEAGVLFALFFLQLIAPDPVIRYVFSAAYILFAVALFAVDRQKMRLFLEGPILTARLILGNRQAIALLSGEPGHAPPPTTGKIPSRRPRGNKSKR